MASWGGQLQRYRDNKALESAELPEGDEPALPSRCVRLTKDMLQFAEEPRPIVILDADGQPLKATILTASLKPHGSTNTMANTISPIQPVTATFSAMP